MNFDKTYSRLLKEYDGDDEDFSRDDRYESGSLARSTYTTDDLDGEMFGEPGKIYSIELEAELDIVDDSDYSREGYGRKVYPEGIEDIIEFNIEEYDESGEVSRTTEQIEAESPETYERLLDYAKTKIIDEYEPQ